MKGSFFVFVSLFPCRHSRAESIRSAKKFETGETLLSSTSVSIVNLRCFFEASLAVFTSCSFMAETSRRCCSRIYSVRSGAAESSTSIRIAEIPFSDISSRLS